MDLAKKVVEGTFRKDLFYRLKVGHITLPPLRERKQESLPLAALFLEEFSKSKKKNFKTISHEAANKLQQYAWPGNIHELRNVMEWVVFMYDDFEVKPEYLRLGNSRQSDFDSIPNTATKLTMDYLKTLPMPTEGLPLEEMMDEVIRMAVEKHAGNKTAAAEYLGLSRRALSYRFDRLRQ